VAIIDEGIVMLGSFVDMHLLVLVRHGLYVGSGGRNLKLAVPDLAVWCGYPVIDGNRSG
jgi:hypothetical protein